MRLLEGLLGATHHARLDFNKAIEVVATSALMQPPPPRPPQGGPGLPGPEHPYNTRQRKAQARGAAAESESRAPKGLAPPLTRQQLRKSIAAADADRPEAEAEVQAAHQRLRDLGLRRCSKCKQVLALDRFRRNVKGKPVLNARSCNACRRVRQPYSDPLTFYAKYLVTLSKRRAKKLGLPHDIDPAFVIDKYKQQHGRCVLCGRRVTLFNHTPHGEAKKRHFHARNISLDQIVPAQGYTRDNVQIVDRNCNFAKCNMTDAEFIDMCRHVANTHGHKPQMRDPYEASEDSVVMPPDFV